MDTPAKTISLMFGELVIETFLYGVFSLMFAFSVWTLFAPGIQELRAFGAKLTLAVSLWLFAFISAHWALSAYNFHRALVTVIEVPDIADAILIINDPATGASVAQLVILLIATLTADAIMTHRMYVIMGRRVWTLIFPFMMMATYTGLAIVATYFSASLPRFIKDATEFKKIVSAAGAFSVGLNIYASALISWKLWTSQRKLRPSAGASIVMGQPRTTRIFIILIESALMFTGASIISIVCQYAGSDWAQPSLLVIPPIAGIAFCLIFLRVRRIGGHTFTQDSGSRYRLGEFQRGNGDGSSNMRRLNTGPTNYTNDLDSTQNNDSVQVKTVVTQEEI